MVKLPHILDTLTIPDSEPFRQLSNHFQNWGSQHQTYMQQLDDGHSNLQESWQGDGANAYSQLHSQMKQASDDHNSQMSQASLTHLGTIAALESAQILQDIALAELAGAGIEFVLGFFTAGATDVLAAPEVADAIANESLAQGEAQGARLLFQNGFKALTGLIEGWQNHKALFDIGGALLGGVSGLAYGITHNESLPQILMTTAMDAQAGFDAGKNLSSDNPITAIKELAGLGIGAFQYTMSGDKGNEDPFATIVGTADMIGGGGHEPNGNASGLTGDEPPTEIPPETPGGGDGDGGRPINSNGDPYPEIIHPETGKEPPFPEGKLQRIPRSDRTTWDSSTDRYNYIKEWYDRGYNTPEGGWEKYDIHHILPREFGGTNDWDNLVPVLRTFHNQVVTPWWNAFEP